MSFDGIRKALRGLAQRLGGTRLGVLAIGRIVSPLQRELYRRTGGRLSLTGRAPVLLLTTIGRRTDTGSEARGAFARTGPFRQDWTYGPVRLGKPSQYQYTTQLSGTDRTGLDEYLVADSLTGNLPGGTATLRWRFTVAGGLIQYLHIAP